MRKNKIILIALSLLMVMLLTADLFPQTAARDKADPKLWGFDWPTIVRYILYGDSTLYNKNFVLENNEKLILPLHFNTEEDFEHYIDSELLDESMWFAVSCRPFSIFTKRKNILEKYNVWNKTHLLAFNSTNRKNIPLIKNAYSFDSSLYNIFAGKFRTMITKNGEKKIVRRMNKTEMILLSLNNAKFYSAFLNTAVKKTIVTAI